MIVGNGTLTRLLLMTMQCQSYYQNSHYYPIDNDVVSSTDWNILLVVVVAAVVVVMTTKRSVALVLTPPLFVFDSNDGKSFPRWTGIFWMTIIVVVIVVDIVAMPQHG
jgi:hypothetical protein